MDFLSKNKSRFLISYLKVLYVMLHYLTVIFNIIFLVKK